MKRIIFALLAFMLVACAAAPTQPSAPLPSPVPPTPQVIVATVLVPVEVTSIPPTSAPANTPLPPPTLAPTEIPTQAQDVSAQTQNVSAPTPTAGAVSGPIAIDPKFNGPSFEKLSVSGDKFSLKCNPKEISFDAYTTDIYIVRVDLYFRMRDKHSADPAEWAIAGTMKTDGSNHFWMTMKGEDVKADLRKYFGWFDFQFVGVNKLGDSVGRSEKITDLVSYTINCP